MKTEINRVFATRESSKIGAHRVGHVELVIDDGKWTLDGKELPAASVAYLAEFALQSLQDAYAGASTPDEATGLFEKKRDRLLAGTMGMRAGGGLDPIEKIILQLARAALKAKKPDAFAKHIKDVDTVEANAWLMTNVVIPNQAHFDKAGKAEHDRRVAEAKAKASITDGLDITI